MFRIVFIFSRETLEVYPGTCGARFGAAFATVKFRSA